MASADVSSIEQRQIVELERAVGNRDAMIREVKCCDVTPRCWNANRAPHYAAPPSSPQNAKSGQEVTMEQIVRKIDAASHQLDWAIRLLIDFDAPMPAITLAGAAEEILGRALPESAHEALIRAFSESHAIECKVLSQQHLNKARNWLKHWDQGSEPEYATFDLVQEAIQGISRGLSNMASYNQSIPSEGPRFLEWIKQNSYLDS